jgi:predicted NBD/HSP70 family sugar kinase
VVNPDSCFSIGLNVDRDHIALVLLDFAGRARAPREIHFAQPATVRSFFQRAVDQVLKLKRPGIARGRVIGVRPCSRKERHRPGRRFS